MKSQSAIFAEAAPVYAESGLFTFPVGADKRPKIKHWPKVRLTTYQKLVRKFPDSNIAVLDGTPGGITRIDIDDPSLIDDCISRFGDTPIKVQTPGGGLHLWYGANGEPRQLAYEGRKIDVLGRGGFGVVPPSRTPKGTYRFIEGSLKDVGRLPILKGLVVEPIAKTAVQSNNRGNRNNWLFYAIKGVASECATEAELTLLGAQFNASMPKPLAEAEVRRTVRSVWRYRVEGRLFTKGTEATAFIHKSDLEALTNDEVGLLARLTIFHGAKKGEPFVLAGLAATTLGFQTVKAMRIAQNGLEAKGKLQVLQRGKKGSHKKTIVRLM